MIKTICKSSGSVKCAKRIGLYSRGHQVRRPESERDGKWTIAFRSCIEESKDGVVERAIEARMAINQRGFDAIRCIGI